MDADLGQLSWFRFRSNNVFWYYYLSLYFAFDDRPWCIVWVDRLTLGSHSWESQVETEVKKVSFLSHVLCWGASYFPTHNGIDPLDEIECIDKKWSLPNDMGPIQCKSVTCPSFPDFGKKIETRCLERDQACVTAGKYANIEDCSCQEAVSTCKPKFITSYNKTFHEFAPLRTRGLSRVSARFKIG